MQAVKDTIPSSVRDNYLEQLKPKIYLPVYTQLLQSRVHQQQEVIDLDEDMTMVTYSSE